MKTLALAVWFAVVIGFSAILGTHTANAQGQYCAGGCWGGNNNRSAFSYYLCEYSCWSCGGGANACETDQCEGSCGSGWQSYCIYSGACGVYPGCFGQTCS